MRLLHRTSASRSAKDLGRLIARTHYRTWRLDAPPLDLSVDELAAILPQLIRSGSAGIVWHRVEPVRERYGALAFALEAATEAQIAHNERVQSAVVEAVMRLRNHGIEPVLVKGWSISRLYPEGIVRPAGDIDLVVRKEEFAAAHAIVHDSSRDRLGIEVDLKHPGIWEERPNDDFWDRLGTADVAGTPVRVLSDEDNLRMLCFHFLKHGGQRPLWLVDIGTVLDRIADERTWMAALGSDKVGASWVQTVASVAHRLVGARGWTAPQPPSWVVSEIERSLPNLLTPLWSTMADLRSNPRDIAGVFRRRWPSPIVAFWKTGTPFDERPPLPTQWNAFLRQIADYAVHRLVHQLKA